MPVVIVMMARGGNLLCPGLGKALMHQAETRLFHCHTGNRLAGQVLRAAKKRGTSLCLNLAWRTFCDSPRRTGTHLATDDLGRKVLIMGKSIHFS